MKITIECEAKEVADLVLRLQNRQEQEAFIPQDSAGNVYGCGIGCTNSDVTKIINSIEKVNKLKDTLEHVHDLANSLGGTTIINNR